MTRGPKITTPVATRQRRLWITLGEAVGVLALVVAGLNYWDSHRERASAEHQAVAQARAKTALVMTGAAEDDGARLALSPLNPAQAIQSQRYVFPSPVLDRVMEISAAKPQVDLGWVAGGLKRALAARSAPAEGESELPVGVVTTYVEDGETYTDRSIYRIGYAFHSRFMFGRSVALQGLSLDRRDVGGDLRALVNARWLAEQRAGSPS